MTESAQSSTIGFPPSATGFITKSVDVSGERRDYVAYVPRTYDRRNSSPAILFLHGMGESGADGLCQVSVGIGPHVMRHPERWPFIIIFPQKRTPEICWEAEDPMVMAILDKTGQELCIDKSRLYLTGNSMGGNGTWSIGAKHPDLFAAIAPICGWGEKWMADKLANTPAWIFHGDADDVVVPEKSMQMAEDMESAGGLPKLTVYKGVQHNSWDHAYAEESLPAWFLQHRK